MSVVLPIEDDPRFRIYTASANQTQFAIAFPFQDEDDIAVYLRDEDDAWQPIEDTLFTISGANVPGGGMLEFHAGRSPGDIVLILGDAVLDRLSSITTSGRFTSALIDAELDRSRIIAQEQSRDIGRAVKVDFGGPALTISGDIADGELLKKQGNRLVGGTNAGDIEAAKDLAVAAAAGASASEAAAAVWAGAAGNSASAAAASQAQAQILVDMATAAYAGFEPGTFYDLGRLADDTTLFPGDLGRLADL